LSKGKQKEPPKKGGRPLSYAREFPVYESMKQASGATKIPISAFQKAAAEGSICFRNGKVYVGEFIEWWFARDWVMPIDGTEPESTDDWNKRDKRAVALTREVNLQKVREQVIEFTAVEKFIHHLVGNLFFGELSRLSHEFPISLNGKSQIEIANEVRRQEQSIQETIKNAMETFIKTKGKK
jgi:ABC-type polysaccharide/polyol phosphate transport system ATPase subunit